MSGKKGNIIYDPSLDPEKHECRKPLMDEYRTGTIWQCSVCNKRWILKWVSGTYRGKKWRRRYLPKKSNVKPKIKTIDGTKDF